LEQLSLSVGYGGISLEVLSRFFSALKDLGHLTVEGQRPGVRWFFDILAGEIYEGEITMGL